MSIKRVSNIIETVSVYSIFKCRGIEREWEIILKLRTKGLNILFSLYLSQELTYILKTWNLFNFEGNNCVEWMTEVYVHLFMTIRQWQ